ncbi:DUF6713 family protein [Paenibacillus massiliensis]|uniref:DUF6713 family protein n=1 Tax=Paenibacillus massiliensis TaxID=225917 RepID=UPI00036281F6|nr:DUF6713 family protein [Paenibacillus massiliensis]
MSDLLLPDRLLPNHLLIVFLLNLSLFLLHEMDAIRHAEWKMFVVLKEMEDSTAYKIFTAIHLPLYLIILYFLFSPHQTIVFWVLDLFFMIHALLHLLFEKHPQNGMKNAYSRSIIYGMGILAMVHVMLLF